MRTCYRHMKQRELIPLLDDGEYRIITKEKMYICKGREDTSPDIQLLPLLDKDKTLINFLLNG